MPYIKPPSRRAALSTAHVARTPGELNYQITMAVMAYLRFKDFDYQTLNDIVGAFECAKQEFIRRIVVPYEDRKREENGDVY